MVGAVGSVVGAAVVGVVVAVVDVVVGEIVDVVVAGTVDATVVVEEEWADEPHAARSSSADRGQSRHATPVRLTRLW